jgi:hypothetical protein
MLLDFDLLRGLGEEIFPDDRDRSGSSSESLYLSLWILIAFVSKILGKGRLYETYQLLPIMLTPFASAIR